MCSKSLLSELLGILTEYSRSLFGDKLKNVILYGSYARGDFDDESDIDVMIIVDMTPQELLKYRWRLSCFCADLNVEYNVLITSKLQSAELLEQWKNHLPFYKNVLREGIVYA